MCLGQGHNVLTQVIAVANSLDPDQTRQKVFPLIVKWVQWWKKWQSFKIWLVFFYGDNETLIKWTTCQPKQNENHQRTKDKRYPMQKSVFGITGQVRFKPASLATETSYIIEILDLERLVILLSIGSEQQRCWSDCADVWSSWKKYSFKNVPTL